MKRFTVWRPLALALSLTCMLAGTASASVTSLSMDPTAQLSPGRLHATLTGSLTCDPGDNLSISGQIVQPKTTSGFGFMSGFPCDGTAQPFALDVSSGGFLGSAGTFKAGKASAQVSTSICDPWVFVCSSTYVDDTIRLIK